MMRLSILMLFMISSVFAQDKKEQLTVYFDSDSFEMASNEENKLVSFFSNPDIQVTSSVIEGFCDDIGSSSDNIVLSEKRAAYVADYLQSNFELIPNAVSGKGEIKLKNTSSDEMEKTRRNNRRVSVFVTYTFTKKNNAKETVQKEGTEPLAEEYKTFENSLKKGDKIIIQNLIFKGSQTTFEDVEKAYAELEKIVTYFKKNPSVQFEVHGHVCCITKSFKDARDKDTKLNNLSESRAKRIYDHFIQNGIAKERMSHKGFGRDRPIPNGKETENKRVEIVITEI